MTYTENDAHSVRGYGATREHRKPYSAESLLKKLMNAAADPYDWQERNNIKDEITNILQSKDGQRYIPTVIEGWFQNAYRRLLLEYPNGVEGTPREKRKADAKAKQAEVEEQIEKAIEKRVELKLLDLILPNGKMLRNCTGRECQQMSKNTGRWLAAVAARVKPNQLVGNVLNEGQVRKLYPAYVRKTVA